MANKRREAQPSRLVGPGMAGERWRGEPGKGQNLPGIDGVGDPGGAKRLPGPAAGTPTASDGALALAAGAHHKLV